MRKLLLLIALLAPIIGFGQLVAEYNFVAVTAAPGDGDYGMNGFFLDTDGRGVTVAGVKPDTTYFFDSAGKKFIIRSKSGSSPFALGVDAVGHASSPVTGVGQLTDLTPNGLPYTSGGVSDKVRSLVSNSGILKADSLFNESGGSGDVVGPGSSTDNAVPTFDGTGGKTLQESGVTIDDFGNIVLPGSVDGRFIAEDGEILDDHADTLIVHDNRIVALEQNANIVDDSIAALRTEIDSKGDLIGLASRTAKSQNPNGIIPNNDIYPVIENKKRVKTVTAHGGFLSWDAKNNPSVLVDNVEGLFVDVIGFREGGRYKITVQNTSISIKRNLAFSPIFFFPEGFVYLPDIGIKNTYIFEERGGVLVNISQPDRFPFYFSTEIVDSTVMWFSGWKNSKNYKSTIHTFHLLSENDSLVFAGNLAGKRHGWTNTSESRRPKLKLLYNSSYYRFDGTDDYFRADSIKVDAKSITETGVFSIVLRYIPGSTVGRNVFDAAGNSTANTGPFATQAANNQITFSAYSNVAGQPLFTVTTGFLGPDGYWYAIIKGDGSNIESYNADGTWTETAFNPSGGFTSNNWTNELHIGVRSSLTAGTYWDGGLSDLIITTNGVSTTFVRDYIAYNKRVDYTYLDAGVSEMSEGGLIFDFDFSDTTKLKQSTISGVSATTIGDTISYCVNSASALPGRNLSITTTGARPTLQLRNGQFVGRFDGIDDFMNFPFIWGGGGMTIFMVVSNMDSTATRNLLGLNNTQFLRWYGDSTLTGQALYEYGYQCFQVSETNGVSASSISYRHSIPRLYQRKDSLMLIEIVFRDPIHEISLNGGPFRNSYFTAKASFLYLCKSSVGSNFKGDIGRIKVFNRVLSDEQILYQRKQLVNQFHMTLVDTINVERYNPINSIPDPNSSKNYRKPWKSGDYYSSILDPDGVGDNDFFGWPTTVVSSDTLYHMQSILASHSGNKGLLRWMKYIEGEDGYYETEYSDVEMPTENRVIAYMISEDTVVGVKLNGAFHTDSLIYMDRNLNRHFALKFDRTISGLDTFFISVSKPFEAKNGVWYLAGYSNTGAYTGRIVRSTDRGRTWTSVAVWPGDGSTFRPEEPCITQIKGDTMMAFIRSDKGSWIWTSKSIDGITWSTPIQAFRGGNRPQVLVTTGDSVIVCTPSRYQAYIGADGVFTDVGEFQSVENTTLKNLKFFTSLDVSWDNGNTWYKYVFDEYRGANFRFSQEGADIVELSPGYIRLFASASAGYWIPSAVSNLSYWDISIGSREGDLMILKR